MTYEYACTACGNAWEAEQSISAAPLTDCPSCHQAAAKRQVSGGAGFMLKGGGWYADGYGNQKSASPKDEGKSAESKSAEGKSAEGKSKEGKSADSKPADGGSSKSTDATPATSTPAATTTPSSGSSGAASS